MTQRENKAEGSIDEMRSEITNLRMSDKIKKKKVRKKETMILICQMGTKMEGRMRKKIRND